MQHLTLRFFVALLAFALGLLAHASWDVFYASRSHGDQVPPVLVTRRNELHKFYEAAAMTGDLELKHAIVLELTCMSDDGLILTWAVDRGSEMVCVDAEGTDHTLYVHTTFAKFISEHRKWSLENLAFLREVGTAQKARHYVFTHEWPAAEVRK
jgi:hypothetical protein